MTVGRQVGVVESSGEAIYFETVGDGDPLVLCHGAGGNHAVWFRQVAAFRGRYRVITWDHRGFGRSSVNGAGQVAVSVGDLAAVLDEVGVDRAHVVGQSMGGWTALGFTVAQPSRAATLTLCDTVAGVSTPAVSQNWTDYIDRVRARSGHGISDAIGTRFVRDDPAGATLYEALSSFNADLSPELMRSLLTTTWTDADVAAVTCPALFVVGDDDAIFPPPVIRDVASRVAGAEVVEIPGAGHSPYFETPDAWNDAVGKFLTAHPVS